MTLGKATCWFLVFTALEPCFAQKAEWEGAIDLFNEAQKSIKAGDRAAAAAALAKLREFELEDYGFYVSLGNLAQSLGQFDEAVRHYQQALGQDPQRLEAHLDLGALYLSAATETNRLAEEALKVYKEAEVLSPDSSTVQIALGTAYSALKMNEEALAAYRKAVRKAPGSPATHRALASFALHLGYTEEARQALDTAMRLDQNDPFLYYYSARLITRDTPGSEDEALAELDRAIALDPTFTKAWIEKAIILRRTSRLREALQALQRALEIEPEMPEAHYQLSRVLAQLGERERAREAAARYRQLRQVNQ